MDGALAYANFGGERINVKKWRAQWG